MKANSSRVNEQLFDNEPVETIINRYAPLVKYHRQRRWLDKGYLEGTLVKVRESPQLE